jgi:hypothetical protein
MGGLTKEMQQVSLNKVNYKESKPDERGNLHERMKHLLHVVKQQKRIPPSIVEAINLLENEIECYDPLPSYGQRQWVKPKPQNRKEG